MTNTEMISMWQRGRKDDVVRFLASVHPARTALLIVYATDPFVAAEWALTTEDCREMAQMLAQHAAQQGPERQVIR